MIAKAQIAKWTTVMATVAFALCARAASYEVVSEADVIALAGAAGGDEIRKIDNGNGTFDIVHIFKSTDAASTFTVPAASEILPGSARVLVVGGGGSGGSDCGGGGGAGGYVYKDALTLTQGFYTINVGAGGAAVLYDGMIGGSSRSGNVGGDSSIVSGDLSITAYGGGGGGSWSSSSGANSTNSGSAGGSSGGACGGYGNVAAATQPGSAWGGLGNRGGAGLAGYTDRAGGGGGAGGPGVAATGTVGGDGGPGVANEISGESIVYAAGGGGRSSGTPGKGGGDSSNTYGDAGTGAVDGYPGLDGTGSGGGGGGGSPHRNSGAGGSGTVIVRYTVQPPAVGAIVTTHNGETIYSFTGTDNVNYLTLPSLVKADILVVGGGGAGANPGAALPFQGGAGGGGAGGMIVGEGVYLEGGTYTITVGKGGVNSGTMQGAGANGEASTVVLGGTVVYEAFGGGGGGILGAGNAGGSGGGGSMAAGGVGVDGQGYAGGQGSVPQAGGGGGGAAAGGGNATVANTGGAGGAGKACSITGAEVIYAAGGGGGTRAGTAAAAGGSSIGGNGGYSGGDATAGKDHTGSGGGGGRLNKAGGAGGSGIVIIRIKAIMPARPEAAYEFAYDGNEHTLYEGAAGVTIADGEGNPIDKITVKDVGTYNYTVSLANGWKWADGSDTTPVNVTVKVNTPALTVDSITVAGWQAGQIPSKPVVVTSPFQLDEGEYTVVYSASEEGPWSTEPPTTRGTYWVTVEIPESENYTSPAQADIPKVSVDIWEFPATEGVKLIDSLGYHVELTIKHEGAALTNFPMLVRFSEDSPVGFKYRHANPDGSDIRFYAADGTQLAYEVETWNPEGESLLWVNVPVYENGAVITAWWGELVDKAPDTLIDSTVVSGETPGVYEASRTFVTPGAYFKNRWLVEPGVSKTEWMEGEAPAEASSGEALYGEAYYTFADVKTTITNEVPTAMGGYTFVGRADGLKPVDGGSCGYEGLMSPEVGVAILNATPYGNLKGTASGRVLLANDHGEGEGAIMGQEYSNTDPANAAGTYWVHTNDANIVNAPHMSRSTESYLMSAGAIEELCDATTVWHLQDTRIGNLYLGNLALRGMFNYLPWSADAKPNGAQGESSHMAMRNIADAAIYSPCYTNGIGTIYFDAVNSMTDSFGRLIVEICTNTVEGLDVPSDENIEKRIATRWEAVVDDEGNAVLDENGTPVTVEIPGETNRYGRAVWTPVKVMVMKKDGTAGFDEPYETDEIALEIERGGSYENFYRIYAKLNYTGPIRFRIRRTEADAAVDVDVGLILVDNVIASYPSMRVDLSSYGELDAAKGGKNTLGNEGAFNVALPSVDDTLYGRGKVTYLKNNGLATADESKFVISTRMFYRWRYLDQKVPGWKSVALDHTALVDGGFKSPATLDLTPNIPGDLEYYYVSWLNAPFYDYVDYSGMDLKLGGYYTENTAVVTNRFDSPVTLESRGTDWFVRLREGRSDYKSINLVIAEQIDDDWNPTVYKTNSIAMELVGKGVWRGVYQTLEANPNGLKFRFEANKVTGETLTGAGSRLDLETNNWYLVQNWNALPVSDVLAVEDRWGANTNEYRWSSLPNDAVTGYLLFQLDDTTRAVTIVHADYQNFNAWNDANKPTKLFVGSSTEDETKAGASPKAISSEASFLNWKNMPKSNEHWIEYFNSSVEISYDPYVKFDTAETPNAWTAGPGMFVYASYKDASNTKVNADNTGSGDLTDYALQMQGNGLGYIQFVDATEAPRGLEEISFSARIGQFINFNDFAYYDSASKISMSNYTVVTAGALDRSRHTAFRGNASLSIIAHYRPGVGCYEFRVEQINATSKAGPNATAARRGQRFSFYRWSYDSTGKLTSTMLGFRDNDGTFNMDWPQPTATSGFMPLYFSVSNSTEGVCLAAGFRNTDTGVTPGWTHSMADNQPFRNLAYIDSSDKRLTSGTYGFLTTNSEGCFARPVFVPSPVALMGTIWNDRSKLNNKIDIYSSTVLDYDSGAAVACQTDLENGLWYIPPGRMVYDDGLRGLKGIIPRQTINIYTAPAGTTAWTLLASKEFASFGTTGPRPTDTFKAYTTGDCSVKIAVGGTLDDARTDVVIDTIRLTQFRGGDWEDAYGFAEDWQADNGNSYGGYTNFIFTTSWIENGAVKLSARQTTPERPSSIRSPLYDGYGGRGIGLGMFSFNYRNAHPKVNLLLQVATNITSAAMANIDRFDDNLWTTVANFSFAGVSDIERAAGTRSCYVGMHGVPGLMRVIMDPAVVASCQGEMDPKNFPQIYITDVFSRDEPALDLSAWWGWNLRTLGDESDGERRMYLYDLTRDLSQAGMSLALNNSTEASVDLTDGATYKEHQPFVQTPTFATNVVGEVQFKARKYDAWSSQPSQVTLYGSVTGKLDDKWTRLKSFIISNDTYSTYTYKTEPGDTFAAFRLGVTGVPGVVSTNPHNQGPDGGYQYPVRVLIDEVLVSEAIRASIAFRGVGAFRHDLDGTAYVPNVPSAEEQPLSGESWGVQCEIFAAQLEDEIDFDRAPVVKLHWFNGEYPWGYDNWKTNAAARSAVLARATGTNMIYRSSYRTAPDAVLPASLIPLETVQYELEVVYYTVGSAIPQTNYLSKAGTWFNPPWYKGVDKNAGKDRFSAYTIIDTVAPGWAWFNEVNIQGMFDVNWNNTDTDYQYAEVAVPAEADITNWSIRFVEMLGDSTIVTNTVATFGVNDLQPTKPNLIGMASNMVYRVIANRQARESGRLKYADGTLDGVWSFKNEGYAMQASGTVWSIQPIGMQLVRSSGVIEHEIALIGENTFEPDNPLYDEYHPTNLVNVLNRNMKGSDFIYIGDDDHGEGFSLSVLTSRGEKKVNWFNDVVCTPGRINEGQDINPDHPTPNGSSIIVYANLDPAVPHIRQTVGDSVLTNASVILVIPKGSQRGTNITYTVDKWYDLKGVTTNGVDIGYTTNGKVDGCKVYTATVGVGVSNNVTVVASAKLDDRLVNDFGLTPDNKYRDAVIDWLEKGRSIKFGEWANPDSDEILLAEYRSLAGTIVTNLTLTQMYWLDMDPTVGDLALYGGMVSPPTPITRSVAIDGADYVEEAVNFKVGVKLYITNTTDDVTGKWYNKPAWAPYVLRGRAKGETSLEYNNTSDYSWSNVTFKVTGFLNNGLNRLSNKDNWIPLRWFVFNEESFDEDFTTSIEIKDPFGTDTPGYSAGWYDWYLRYGATPVFFSWSLDTRLRQFPVEALKEENHYDYE